MNDIIEYYLTKNEIRYLDENSKILNDKNKFKETIKKTLTDVYEDLKLYHNDAIHDKALFEKIYNKFQIVYDKTSGLFIVDDERGFFYSPLDIEKIYKLNDDIIDKSFVMLNNAIFV